jgi:hypothetical protein
MIAPTTADFGRWVVLVATGESGRIVTFDYDTVYVAFPDRSLDERTVDGCRRDELAWVKETT